MTYNLKRCCVCGVKAYVYHTHDPITPYMVRCQYPWCRNIKALSAFSPQTAADGWNKLN